jgi:hypothetical protein
MAVELESRATSTEVNPSAHKLGGQAVEENSMGGVSHKNGMEMPWKCHGNGMRISGRWFFGTME